MRRQRTEERGILIRLMTERPRRITAVVQRTVEFDEGKEDASKTFKLSHFSDCIRYNMMEIFACRFRFDSIYVGILNVKFYELSK